MAGATSDVSNNKKHLSYFYARKHAVDELDVLEAARHYSGQNDGISHPLRTRRMSLDEHVKRPSLLLPQGLGKQVSSNSNNSGSRHIFEQRQPRSPGGRLASFLNSFFIHSSLKKKVPSNKSSSAGGSSSALQPSEKECEDPDQRRGKSSINHFSSSTNESRYKPSTDGVSNFYHTSNNSRTSKVVTPTKSHKDLRSSISDHRQASASNMTMASKAEMMKKTSLLESKSSDKEIMDSSSKFHGKSNKNSSNNKIHKKDCSKESALGDQDGGSSDSSSDLFELQIGTGRYYSSDLPVYETTHIQNMRTSTPPISFKSSF